MDLNFKNRNVLITGVSEGIGRSMALAFAKSGARIAGCSRNQAGLDRITSEIQGDDHCFFPADLSNSESARSFNEKVLQAFGGLDVLINNVGSIHKLADFHALNDDDWEQSFQINLMSAVRMIRFWIPHLKQSRQARIINISSIAADRPTEVFPHYSAMKAGLSNLTLSLSQTLANDKILVNTVSPGPVWSRSWEQEAEQAAKKSGATLEDTIHQIKEGTGQTVLLKRMGLPEDVTGIVQFLASDHASWVTGTNFTVDGGLTRGS